MKTANASKAAPGANSIHSRPGKGLSTFVMLAATAVMLSLLFPPFYCFFLAPVALVPFCVCILRRPLKVRFLAWYYLLGAVFFLANLFWMFPVTFGGTLALSLFVALYFPLFALALHRLVIQFRMPSTLAVPLAWTAVEYIRATYVLEGFPWFLLGNCLTPIPLLLQTADLFGVWGLTFLIALFSGFMVDVLRLPLRKVVDGKSVFSPVIGTLTAVAAVMAAFAAGYGVFRLSQETTRPGPRVAVIQENIPQEIKDKADTRDDVFIRHLVLSEQAIHATPAPDMVAWPETMITAPMNEELVGGVPDTFTTVEELRTALKGATDLRRVDNIYKAVTNQADRGGIPLLLGYAAFVPVSDVSMKIQNRTMLMLPQPMERLTRRVPQEYSKIHLVPFGEYIPFRNVPGVNKLLLLLSPVDYDYTNTPGTEWTRFRLTVKPIAGERAEETFTFATPICFEDVMPEPARMMSSPQFGGGRKTDFLMNVSNDGWFHWVQLDQHLQACQLRAVENRIPIARAVNTGNSGFIDSNGRILALVGDRNSIGFVGSRAMIMPIDSRITLYSRIGDLLPILCGVITTLLVGWTFVRPRRPA